MTTRYAVLFMSGRVLRDRLYTAPNGRNGMYWTEAPREGAGMDIANPPQVFMVDTVDDQELLIQALIRKHPGCACSKATVNEVITSIIPENIKTSRAKWSDKGLLPA